MCNDHEVRASKESKVKNPQKISKLGVGGTVKRSGMLNSPDCGQGVKL